MFCEMIDDAFLVSMSGTSEGTQIKYYKDGYWYKKDSFGGEATAEYLSSRLLTFSDLSAGDYVTYECGNLNVSTSCQKAGKSMKTFSGMKHRKSGQILCLLISAKTAPLTFQIIFPGSSLLILSF